MNQKRLVFAAGVVLLICFIGAAGCVSSPQGQVSSPSQVATPTQEIPPAQYIPPTQVIPPAQNSGQISLEDAKAIALRHAGVPANQATFTKTQIDYENGFQVYEIDFYSGSTKYEYDIDAYSGNIVKNEKETFYVQGQTPGSQAYSPQTTPAYISADKAGEIALNRAGLSMGSVYGYKCKFDSYDDDYRRAVYEIEFNANMMEYDIDVDAISGDILKYNAEYD